MAPGTADRIDTRVDGLGPNLMYLWKSSHPATSGGIRTSTLGPRIQDPLASAVDRTARTTVGQRPSVRHVRDVTRPSRQPRS